MPIVDRSLEEEDSCWRAALGEIERDSSEAEKVQRVEREMQGGKQSVKQK